MKLNDKGLIRNFVNELPSDLQPVFCVHVLNGGFYSVFNQLHYFHPRTFKPIFNLRDGKKCSMALKTNEDKET